MDATEAGKLLLILAAVTEREPTAAKAQGWAYALDDLPYEIGEQALHAALRSPDAGFITPQTIRRHAAPMLRRLAADVRSAKLRGLVVKAWPETRPLPAEILQRLAEEWQATNDTAELSAGTTPPPKEIHP